MEPMDEHHCRQVLEITDLASMEEINQAYQRLKRIYGSDASTFSAPFMDEFSPESRKQILAEVEAAYRELCRIRTVAQANVHLPPARTLAPDQSVDGLTLRRAREAAGFTLEHVVSETNVRLEFLSALEDERFADLPPATVYVRGYLTSYLTAIGLMSEQIVSEYMHRHQSWQAKRSK